MRERRRYYLECADWIVQTARHTPMQICRAIFQEYQKSAYEAAAASSSRIPFLNGAAAGAGA
jgi:hypothetical protein